MQNKVDQGTKIDYRITLASGRRLDYALRLSPASLALEDWSQHPPPSWAALDFLQCPGCPLDRSTHRFCPVAANIAGVIDDWTDVVSHEQVQVEVVTSQRTVADIRPAQKVLSSLLGVVIATSACPHTLFFRAMARFHLPFASPEETAFRALSAYLVMQYLRHEEGKQADFQLEGLIGIYERMQVLNRRMAERIHAVAPKDAPINAVVSLDTLAKLLTFSLREAKRVLRTTFAAFLDSEASTALDEASEAPRDNTRSAEPGPTQPRAGRKPGPSKS